MTAPLAFTRSIDLILFLILTAHSLGGIFMCKNKHLSLDQRIMIQSQLDQGSSFKKIALLIGKDCTTISKEVRKHIRKEKSGAAGRAFNDCLLCYQHSCSIRSLCSRCSSRSKRLCWACGKCMDTCTSYTPFVCPSLKKPPYVCNACSIRSRCSLEKSFYRASFAQKQYDTLKTESRSGFALSEEEVSHLDSVVSPLLRNGQSIHHIAVHHKDETMVSERTLYTYVNNGLFSARNIDMPRTVRMRPRKRKKTGIKVDKTCRIGRSFQDYQTFLQDHPSLPVRQIDSLEGIRGGPVLLTIHFVQQELQLAFLRTANDSRSVIDIFDRLYLILGSDTFSRLFPVLLADNGSEFSNPGAIEYDPHGNQRTHLFYCDPNAPYQKGHCENNHEMIRRCIPKGTDLSRFTQDQISLMMSHINSYARPNLGDKSPYDVFSFQYGEEILLALGQQKIPADEINLTPRIFQ